MNNDQMTPEELEDRLVDFAVRIGKVADALPDTRLGQHIADQLVRSGTSPAPDYSEGCAGGSQKDFARKPSISLKELRETKTWLRITRKADLLSAQRLHAITDGTDQLYAIRSQSVHAANEKVRGWQARPSTMLGEQWGSPVASSRSG